MGLPSRFPSLTALVRKLRSRKEEGLAEVTLLFSGTANPVLEVRRKPKKNTGSSGCIFLSSKGRSIQSPVGISVVPLCFSGPDLAILGGEHATFGKCMQITSMPLCPRQSHCTHIRAGGKMQSCSLG